MLVQQGGDVLVQIEASFGEVSYVVLQAWPSGDMIAGNLVGVTLGSTQYFMDAHGRRTATGTAASEETLGLEGPTR